MKPAVKLGPCLDALWATLVDTHIIDSSGWAGADADSWVPGGFVRLRIDRFDQPRLFANQQGGFKVRCPRCAQGIVAAMHKALRDGVHQALCDECGHQSDLNDLDYSPPAAFSRWAVVFTDAQSAVPTDHAMSQLQARLGPCRLVWRRT